MEEEYKRLKQRGRREESTDGKNAWLWFRRRKKRVSIKGQNLT